MEPWQLRFGGQCEPDPGGPMKIGWQVVRTDTGEMEHKGKLLIPAPTNTTIIANYIALFLALKHLLAWRKSVAKYPGVVISSDCEAVCNQIAERWDVEGERQGKAHKQCLDLLAQINGPYSTEMLPPETNLLTRRDTLRGRMAASPVTESEG